MTTPPELTRSFAGPPQFGFIRGRDDLRTYVNVYWDDPGRGRIPLDELPREGLAAGDLLAFQPTTFTARRSGDPQPVRVKQVYRLPPGRASAIGAVYVVSVERSDDRATDRGDAVSTDRRRDHSRNQSGFITSRADPAGEVLLVTVRWSEGGRLGRVTVNQLSDVLRRRDLSFQEVNAAGRRVGQPIPLEVIRTHRVRGTSSTAVADAFRVIVARTDARPDDRVDPLPKLDRFVTQDGNEVTTYRHPDAGRPNVAATAQLVRVTPLGPDGTPTGPPRAWPGAFATIDLTPDPSPDPDPNSAPDREPPTMTDRRAVRRFLEWARHERGWFLSRYPDGSASDHPIPLSNYTDDYVAWKWYDAVHDAEEDE